MKTEDEDDEMSKKYKVTNQNEFFNYIQRKKGFSVSDFRPIAILGSGSFGQVFLVEEGVTK